MWYEGGGPFVDDSTGEVYCTAEDCDYLDDQSGDGEAEYATTVINYRTARDALNQARVARDFYPVVVPVSFFNKVTKKMNAMIPVTSMSQCGMKVMDPSSMTAPARSIAQQRTATALTTNTETIRKSLPRQSSTIAPLETP